MKQNRPLIRRLLGIEGLPIALVLILLFVVYILTAPTVFLHPAIYMSFLETVPYNSLIIGLGLTLVITAGEIDLSFPAVVALSGFVLTWAYRTFDPSYGAWIGIILAIGAGALVGYINGIMVARIGVPSIMATLAAQFFWYGITLILAGGLSVAMQGLSTNLAHNVFVSQIFAGPLLGPTGLPVQALWALGLAVLLWFILNRHKFGESISFIGDNANVARVMGINVEVTRIRLFTLQGMIAAFSGIILTFDVGTFFPTQGNVLLPVMAAVFVGGTSIAGGAGSIVGTFFGAYIIGSLEAGITATTISGYFVQAIEGVVMGAVIILNALLGEGRISSMTNRLRHWGVPLHTTSPEQTLAKDDSAPI
jgi:simple sugar transport system permease protein